MLSLLYFIRGIVMIGTVGAIPLTIICTLIFACKSYCTNDFWEKLQFAITSWKVVICTHPIRFWIAPLIMAARKRIVTLIFPCQLEERKTWVRTFVKIHKCTSTLLFQHSGLSVLESIKSQQFITLIAPKTLSVSYFLGTPIILHNSHNVDNAFLNQMAQLFFHSTLIPFDANDSKFLLKSTFSVLFTKYKT